MTNLTTFSLVDEKQSKVSSARDQMQLPLSIENDSSGDTGRKTNTQQEVPPKIRKPSRLPTAKCEFAQLS